MNLASYNECTSCMACVDSCPHNVLAATIDRNGYYSIAAKPEEQCIECGRCSQVCPALNFNKLTGESEPYAAWNRNSAQRKCSASGGIFAAFASLVIKKGGSVYGAAIDRFEIRHIRVTSESELPRLQGSKYQHSDMTGIYKQVRNDLCQGMYVLFSGLGCQVAGLFSFLGKTKKDKLYTIDTVCGGISTMLPMLHLKETGKYKGIISFRDKEHGWQSKGFKYSLKMLCKDGSIEDLGLNNMVLNAFSSKLLKRSACLDCKFTGFHRISDCTIGDFWGDESFKQQHREGLSVFIAHNDRIMSLAKEANMEMVHVAWKEVIAFNRNVYWTHYPLIRYLFSRKKALNAMQNKDYKAVAKEINPWSISGLLLRVYLKLNTLIAIFIGNSYISNNRKKK